MPGTASENESGDVESDTADDPPLLDDARLGICDGYGGVLLPTLSPSNAERSNLTICVCKHLFLMMMKMKNFLVTVSMTRSLMKNFRYLMNIHTALMIVITMMIVIIQPICESGPVFDPSGNDPRNT